MKGVVVGDGAHERAGEPHAEVHALNEAGEKARGATLLLHAGSLCSHTGRTGPCTSGIIAAASRASWAAMEDPFRRTRPRARGAPRRTGYRRGRTRARRGSRLNQPFLTTVG